MKKNDRKIINKILDLKELNLEIIIVDDNSTDSSRSIIDTKLKDKIHKQFKR